MGHNFTDRTWLIEKGIVELRAAISVGAAGAITFQQFNPSTRTYSAAPAGGFRGFKSITRTGTGAWTLALDQPYVRVTGLQAVSSIAGGLAAAPICSVNATGTNVNSQTAPQVNIQFVNGSGVATDPANGEQILLSLELQVSTAP